MTTVRSLLGRIYLSLRRIPLLLCRPLFGRRRQLPDSFERILIIRWDRIGDMVLSTPALEALRRRFPDAGIDVLASSMNAPVLIKHPSVDNVIVWKGPPGSLWSYRSPGAVRLLRRNGYDLVLDMIMDWPVSSALLAALVAPYRSGFREAGKEAFYTLQGSEPDRGRHLVENNARLLEILGVTSADTHPYLGIKRREPGYPVRVGIHPGGFYPAQRWPAGCWIELIQRMRKDTPVKEVVLLHDPGADNSLEDDWRREMPGSDIIRSENVYDLIETIQELDTLLCNNSGPLHIAGALGVPTLSTMGPTNPDLWWPLGEGQVVVRSHTSSVEDITVEDMMQGWKVLLDYCRDFD